MAPSRACILSAAHSCEVPGVHGVYGARLPSSGRRLSTARPLLAGVVSGAGA